MQTVKLYTKFEHRREYLDVTQLSAASSLQASQRGQSMAVSKMKACERDSDIWRSLNGNYFVPRESGLLVEGERSKLGLSSQNRDGAGMVGKLQY
jgi:hypothetical protein